MFKFLKLLNKDVISLPKKIIPMVMSNITLQYKPMKKDSSTESEILYWNAPQITFDSLTQVLEKKIFRVEEISNIIFSIDSLIITNYNTITISQILNCLQTINYSSEAFEIVQYVIEEKTLDLIQKTQIVRPNDLLKILYELARRKKNFFIDQIFKESIKHFRFFEDRSNFSYLVDFISLYFLQYDKILASKSLKQEMLNILNKRILLEYELCDISDSIKLISVTGLLDLPNLNIIKHCYKNIQNSSVHSNYEEILIFIGILISQDKVPEIRNDLLSSYFPTKAFLSLNSAQKLKFRSLCFLNFNKELKPGYYIQYLTDFGYEELITLAILSKNSTETEAMEMIGNKILEYNKSWKLDDLPILIELFEKMRNENIRKEFYHSFEKYYVSLKDKMDKNMIKKIAVVLKDQTK